MLRLKINKINKILKILQNTLCVIFKICKKKSFFTRISQIVNKFDNQHSIIGLEEKTMQLQHI